MSQFALHFRNYFSAGLIGSVIGLISFPLLTRSLTVEEYGWIGLVTATLTVFISVGKLGLSSSVIRYFSEARAKGNGAQQELISNIAGASLLLASVSLGLWLLYTHFAVPLLKDGEQTVPLFYVAAVLLPIGVVFSIATSVLKADQRSARVSSLTVLDKVGRLTLIVAVVFTVGATASRILYVAVIVEIVVLCTALFWCRQYLINTRPTLSSTTLRPMVLFGVPLMAKELVGVLLETGDKYIIQGYLGGEALGHYSAAVNVTMYLEWVLLLALDNTIVPQYVKLFEERGREATQRFLNAAAEMYFIVGLGVFAVFSSAAPALVLLLAGERYAPGLVVIPWLTLGLVHFGALTITGAGAFVLKRPKPLLTWTVVALVFNFGFNLLTVPIWGIQAAAVVTCLASLLQFFGVQWSFRHEFPVVLPLSLMGTGLAVGLIALTLTAQIETGYVLLDLVARGAVSTVLYISAMLALSARVRMWLSVAFKRRPPSAVGLG
ncbi:MAG: oligosaccharide flippase family protein, partial [Pseudomonadota bacterium]